ncbi:MAG: ABC transporter permease [Alphaproteobacteria bacterium]|nr:ABC transporter permease [Alphaproteobacteria bacterium]
MHEGLRVQGRVLHALILREMTAQYGGTALGYLWGLLNPMVAILVLYAIFSNMHRISPPGIPLLMFLITSYLTYNYFMAAFSRASGAVQANTALLNYPQVSPLDVLMGRYILDALTYTLVLLIFTIIGVLVEGPYWPLHPGAAILTFWSAGLMGHGLGTIVGTLRPKIRSLDNIVSPILRLGFFISGVVFTAHMLPSWTLPYLDWNPLFHITELMREAWFASYESPFADFSYVGLILFFMTGAALVLERMGRRWITE